MDIRAKQGRQSIVHQDNELALGRHTPGSNAGIAVSRRDRKEAMPQSAMAGHIATRNHEATRPTMGRPLQLGINGLNAGLAHLEECLKSLTSSDL